MAALTIGAALVSAPVESAQDLGNPLTVTAHVTDYANLSRKELGDAQAYAGAAYRAAGIDLVWLPTRSGAASESADTGSRSIGVRVVIMPKDMVEKKCRTEHIGAKVMGVAMSGATDARGRIAYIFFDRIQHVVTSRHTPLVRGLGYVMAHEIGHLLIGVNSHSDEGLMRAGWNPREQGVQTFTESQVQQIWRRFSAEPAAPGPGHSLDSGE